MRNASNTYISQLAKPLRNIGHIDARLRVFSSDARRSVSLSGPEQYLVPYGDGDYGTLFREDSKVTKLYASTERNFSLADGKTMYFLPEASNIPHTEGNRERFYYNGAISRGLDGKIRISFGGAKVNVYGITIDFVPHCVPDTLIVEATIDGFTDVVLVSTPRHYEYEVIGPYRNVSEFIISGAGPMNRMRIHRFLPGVILKFDDSEVGEYTFKDFVSPIAESLSTHDAMITVNNRLLQYYPDNPDSIYHFFEDEQVLTVQFGYDLAAKTVYNTPPVEWIDKHTFYLKSWEADERDAKFMAVDKYYFQLNEPYPNYKFYRGASYAPQPLYYIAQDIIDVGHLADSPDEFEIPTRWQYEFIENPFPDNVTVGQALQIAANAGRCIIDFDRGNRLRIRDRVNTPSYRLSRNTELKDAYPKAIRPEKIRNLIINRTTFTLGGWRDIEKNTGTYRRMKASDPTGNALSIVTKEQYGEVNATIRVISCNAVPAEEINNHIGVVINSIWMSSAYVWIVDFYFRFFDMPSTFELAYEYTVTGRPYVKNTVPYTYQINKEGVDIKWDNPLINTVEQARNLAAWMAPYFRSQIEYDIAWRGDPRVDAGDVVRYQPKNNADSTMRIYQSELKFTGAWSGAIKGRKE